MLSSYITGFLVEIFSSYQGEGGALRGSCYGKRQVFIRFAGCNIASGDFGSQYCGCIWCDSPDSKKQEIAEATVQVSPGVMDFRKFQNPRNVEFVLNQVERLKSQDLHSISFTGGEPLLQTDYCEALAERLTDSGYALYLETNGSLPEAAERVVHLFKYCCCDIKDKSSGASDDSRWKRLVEKELSTLRIFSDAGKEVFAKIVVTSETTEKNISWISEELVAMNVPLCIQLVTPYGPVKEAPNIRHIFKLTEAATKYLDPSDVCVGAQMHKVIGIL